MRRRVSSVGRHTPMRLTDSRHSGSRCLTVSRKKPVRFVHGRLNDIRRGLMCRVSGALRNVDRWGGCQVKPGSPCSRLPAKSFRLSTEVLLLRANDWLRQLPARHKSPWHHRCYFKCCTQKMTGGKKKKNPGLPETCKESSRVFWKASPWKDFLRAPAAHEWKVQSHRKGYSSKLCISADEAWGRLIRSQLRASSNGWRLWLHSCTRTCRIRSSPTRSPVCRSRRQMNK